MPDTTDYRVALFEALHEGNVEKAIGAFEGLRALLCDEIDALNRVLQSLGDWRLDKAIEHTAELRRLAAALGTPADDLSWIDRYHGWFLEAREKIDKALGRT